MKEYQFQYTKKLHTLLVLLGCVAAFILVMFIGVHLSIQRDVLILIEIPLVFITFRVTKKFAVSNCTAKLSDASVNFEFDNITKEIIFKDLISFKSYYGKNGPVLYLNTNSEHFQLFANNNFCKTENFRVFCDDIIVLLGKTKEANDSKLIHEGSVFTKKGMLYFLAIATAIYLAAFFFETFALRFAIGIGGGLYLLLMWAKYFSENKKTNI